MQHLQSPLDLWGVNFLKFSTALAAKCLKVTARCSYSTNDIPVFTSRARVSHPYFSLTLVPLRCGIKMCFLILD